MNNVHVPVMGESWLAFDSNPAYINDHAVFKARDGGWHMIGITHDKVLGGYLPVPWAEEEFAHAVADDLESEWTALPRVLKADKSIGETHAWAPHVVYHDGLYYCFYAGGGGHWDSMINLATSPDLVRWTRCPDNPLFRDFYDARDPMALKVGDEWVMYYTKTFSREERYATVAYRTSGDLVRWSEPEFAFVDRTLHTRIPNSGHTESPFVCEHRGLYYLFVCTPDIGYKVTRVFVSDDPFHFDTDDEVTTLKAHCAEVVRDGDRWFVSHAGWFYDGMYLAPLRWENARKFSPSARFADCGENEDYLVGRAMATKEVSGAGRALKVLPGKFLEYEFPVPKDASRVMIAFDELGETRVSADNKVILDENNSGKGEQTTHAIEIKDALMWEDGLVRVKLEDSGPGFHDRPAITYVKIYYR